MQKRIKQTHKWTLTPAVAISSLSFLQSPTQIAQSIMRNIKYHGKPH